MVEKAVEFENGYIEVHGWWFNASGVLVNSKYAQDSSATDTSKVVGMTSDLFKHLPQFISECKVKELLNLVYIFAKVIINLY